MLSTFSTNIYDMHVTLFPKKACGNRSTCTSSWQLIWSMKKKGAGCLPSFFKALMMDFIFKLLFLLLPLHGWFISQDLVRALSAPRTARIRRAQRTWSRSHLPLPATPSTDTHTHMTAISPPLTHTSPLSLSSGSQEREAAWLLSGAETLSGSIQSCGFWCSWGKWLKVANAKHIIRTR